MVSAFVIKCHFIWVTILPNDTLTEWHFIYGICFVFMAVEIESHLLFDNDSERTARPEHLKWRRQDFCSGDNLSNE